MGVKARYKLRNRVKGDVQDDRTKEKSNGTKKCMKGRIHMCVCVCACVCWVGSHPAVKLGWLHHLSAYISPGLQTLTRHFSYNLGTRASLSLTHTHTHTHPNTYTDLCLDM